MYEVTVSAETLQVHRAGTRWLSGGFDGGFRRADAAYNVSVPEGWKRSDLDAYVEHRRQAAGFAAPGPALLTGVDLSHLRVARHGPVTVCATAGLSNPAALPMSPGGDESTGADRRPPGTVNLIVGTERALDDGALANLLAVVAEAKAATLLAATGFPGTTTDAVIVGCDPSGDPAPFSGSATAVGEAARACTRDAVRASLASRYPDREFPATVEDADHGVRTTIAADVESVGNGG